MNTVQKSPLGKTSANPATPFWLALSLLAFPTHLRPATLTLTPIADAEIRTQYPVNNFGAGPTIVSGGLGEIVGNALRRALLQFDLTPIPTGSTITSANLVLSVVRAPPEPAESNFELHRLLRPWTESGVTWTWTTGPEAPWTTAGAASPADMDPVPSGSVPVYGLGTYTITSTPALVAEVQAWLDTPSTNHGWLLRSDTEAPYTACHFASREDTLNAPQLLLEFTPPAAPVIQNISATGGQLHFTFDAEAGRTYTVELRASISSGTWTSLTNIPAQPAPATIFIVNDLAGAQRFFRIRTP